MQRWASTGRSGAVSDNSQLGSLTALLAETLDRRGLDSSALMLRAGIDPAALSRPDVRVTSDQVDRLWHAVMEASGGDLGIAIDHARRFHAGTLHVLGFGLYASASLVEATERVARAVRIVTRAPRVSCDRYRSEFRVTIEATYPGSAPPKQVVFHAALLGLWRSLLRPDVTPVRVQFLDLRRPGDAGVARYIDEFFGCPVQYGQPVSRMTLALDVAQTALPTANADLARRGDEVVTAYLAELDRSALSSAVVGRITEGSFDKKSVARRLGVSPGTLQRRLQSEGVSFTELLLDTRRALAAKYLRSGRYSVKEVSYMLGYADPANFCRAFRSWYGSRPDEFRRRRPGA